MHKYIFYATLLLKYCLIHNKFFCKEDDNIKGGLLQKYKSGLCTIDHYTFINIWLTLSLLEILFLKTVLKSRRTFIEVLTWKMPFDYINRNKIK